jgi:hypothetical protein
VTGRFRSAILCEDIRDEVGNKKSLMGVIGGDILVPSFPSTIKFALFLEYLPSADDRDQVSAEFRLMQNDLEIARGKFEAAIQPHQSANFILPPGLVVFETGADFRMLIAINGRPEEEILRKKVAQQPATS